MGKRSYRIRTAVLVEVGIVGRAKKPPLSTKTVLTRHLALGAHASARCRYLSIDTSLKSDGTLPAMEIGDAYGLGPDAASTRLPSRDRSTSSSNRTRSGGRPPRPGSARSRPLPAQTGAPLR